MISVLLTMLVQTATTPVVASDADMSRARNRAQPVLERYYSAVRRCGARPPFKPTIKTSSRGGIIHYDQPTGSLAIYPWSVADEGLRAMAAEHATEHGGDLREAYEGIFNDLLVAHELGHWLQGFQPERRTADGQFDNWFSEQNANRLMVAFWREHSDSREAADRRLSAYVGAAKPNPVPPSDGLSLESFFTRDTMTIVRGGGYGWYQAFMTRRAMDERPQPGFCALVGEWLPLRG